MTTLKRRAAAVSAPLLLAVTLTALALRLTV